MLRRAFAQAFVKAQQGLNGGGVFKPLSGCLYADAGGSAQHSSEIADYLYDDIKGISGAFMVLIAEDWRYRSFQPLKNIDI